MAGCASAEDQEQLKRVIQVAQETSEQGLGSMCLMRPQLWIICLKLGTASGTVRQADHQQEPHYMVEPSIGLQGRRMSFVQQHQWCPVISVSTHL